MARPPAVRRARTDRYASYWAKTIPSWGRKGMQVEAMVDGRWVRGTLARLTRTHLCVDTAEGTVVLDLEDLRAIQEPLPVPV